MFQLKDLKTHSNNKGFSLVEILVSIAILAVILVPLAFNMISSSKMNTKSKQIASSSDLSTTMVEIMQSVDLSDVLTDVNGYSTDEYGAKLPYSLTKTALKNYQIGNAAETIKKGDKYIPVKKQEDVAQENQVTSSIKTRTTGDVTKTYFKGQDSGEYSFLLSNVESDEQMVDVLTTITPEQKLSLVNIQAMDQSEVAYMKQDNSMDMDVANTFKQSNDTYIALKGKNIPSISADWALKNMERTIKVSIVQDAFSEATTITINAEYTLDTKGLRDRDRKITKNLGSFTTNSTSEFAKGVYLYYYPLVDFNDTTNPRDHFIIENKNELSTPIFLIAMSDDQNVDLNAMPNYHPTLHLEELSDAIYTDSARTKVCSNISDEKWTKSVYPQGRTFKVNTIGNVTDQQTMYKVNVEIYKHKEDSYSDSGEFVPNKKHLLANTIGSFIDTSEKHDIESDKTTGITPMPGIANAGKYELTYNGEYQKGVFGSGVTWEGVTEAKEAGTYVAKATPSTGYAWADGSTTPKTFTWTIERLAKATTITKQFTYNAQEQVGVEGKFVTLQGTIKAKDAGLYVATATPDANHAWEDGSTSPKTIKWRIQPKEVQLQWAEGVGKDRWEYDGKPHSGTCQVLGVLGNDTCYPVLRDNVIQNVGVKTAYVSGLSNKNYQLPSKNLSHQLAISNLTSAKVVLGNTQDLVYDGTIKNAISSSSGVFFVGNHTAKNAGTYNFVAQLLPGYTWEDGTTSPKQFSWTIKQRPITLKWGENTWVYDGKEHSTTCEVQNVIDGDEVKIQLNNNSITNAGEKMVQATNISNKNYKFTVDTPTYRISVVRAKLAKVETHDFNYDGNVHVGVTGEYVTTQGTTSSSEVNIENDLVAPYKVKVTPNQNYAWEDGKWDTREVSWKISPIKDAWVKSSDYTYSGQEVSGIYGENISCTGQYKAVDIGKYVAVVRPSQNHAWEDGSVAPKTIEWEIIRTNFSKPSFAQSEFVYNAKNQKPSLNVYTMNNGYTLQGTFEAKNAGKYSVVAKLKDPANSTWADGTNTPITLSWEIKQKPLTAYPKDTRWEYDKTTHVGKLRFEGIEEGDVCEGIYENNTIINAGYQTAYLKGVTNPNYTIKPQDFSIGVNARDLYPIWDKTKFEYDGKPHMPKISGYYRPDGSVALLPGDTFNVEMDGSPATLPGKYTTRILTWDNYNYTIANRDLTYVEYEIVAKKIDPPILSDFTYNGSPQSPIKRMQGIIWSGQTSGVNAGSYVAYATPAEGYTWTDGTTNKKTYTWTIKKSPTATASLISSSFKYNGAHQVGVRGTHVDWSGTTGATNPGTYTAYARPSTNYTWADGTTSQKSFRWTIQASKTASIQAKNGGSLDFNGSRQIGVIGSNVNWTGTTGATNAGKYTAYATPTSDATWPGGGRERRAITWTIRGWGVGDRFRLRAGATYSNGQGIPQFIWQHQNKGGYFWVTQVYRPDNLVFSWQGPQGGTTGSIHPKHIQRS